MLKNYLKIAWRNLLRHKLFSFINISGLAIGMTACLLILQYVSFELSFDSFHKNHTSVYRVQQERVVNGTVRDRSASTFSGVARRIREELPEVQAATGLWVLDAIISRTNEQGGLLTFKEKNVVYADSSFFDVFSFPLVEGQADFSQPNNIILTEHLAKKYFGNVDPIGKTLKIENHNQGIYFVGPVKAICKDLPANSHLQFDCIVSRKPTQGRWSIPDVYTYLLLGKNTDPKRLEAKLPGFVHGYMEKNNVGNAGVVNFNFSLVPLDKIHLYSDYPNELGVNGNGKFVWFLALIAGVILTIAYINYINLSSIKSIERAKEVGLRKVFGSERSALIRQFTFESLVINAFAIVMAVGITLLLHRPFCALIGESLPYSFWANILLWLALIACGSIGAFLSGLYPAFLLSSYRPIQVLKGKIMASGSGIGIRKVLVVCQFTVSIILIIGTYVIYRQVTYMRNKDLGINLAQTIVVNAPAVDTESESIGEKGFYQRIRAFHEQVLKDIPAVSSVTECSSIPGTESDWQRPYKLREDQLDMKGGTVFPTIAIGADFVEMFHLKLLAGQNFRVLPSAPEAAPPAPSAQPAPAPGVAPATPAPSPERPPISVMLNEAAVTSLGFRDTKSSVGQIFYDKNGSGRVLRLKVLGVVNNYNQKSVKESYSPIVFWQEDGSSIGYYALKINAADIHSTVARIQSVYRNIFPSSSFDFFFLDDYFNRQYKQDEVFGNVFSVFSCLAIFVGCLGLLGLAMFASMQRRREIGVRKVLGASNSGILVLLFEEFFKLIVVSSLIAWPIAWLGLNYWLVSYPFRISLNPLMFLLPTLLVVVIAFVTVGLQSWKASTANPIKSIRYE